MLRQSKVLVLWEHLNWTWYWGWVSEDFLVSVASKWKSDGREAGCVLLQRLGVCNDLEAWDSGAYHGDQKYASSGCRPCREVEWSLSLGSLWKPFYKSHHFCMTMMRWCHTLWDAWLAIARTEGGMELPKEIQSVEFWKRQFRGAVLVNEEVGSQFCIEGKERRL